MIIINKQTDGDALKVRMAGRIDMQTAPQLDKDLKESLGAVKTLDIDLGEVEYISSAGLRVLLGLYKTMSAQQGTMVLRNLQEDVFEIFKVTGFDSIFTIA